MKAVRLVGSNGLDGLRMLDVPDPGAPQSGELRVRIRASSLNYHDYGVVRSGDAQFTNRIPLSDCAGIVEAVGDGVSGFKVGDHVVSCFLPAWQDGPAPVVEFSGVPGDGTDGYACEVTVRPASWFTLAPKSLDHAAAATITTAGVTAWRGLIDGRLKAGDSVLVMGTGGVSIFALQIAKAMGARVIATSSKEEKLARLRSLGADETLNYKTQPDWGTAVAKLTGGGVDHVIEIGGPGTLAQSIAAVRPGGSIALIGVLTGFAGTVPTGLLMRKQAHLRGIIVGSRRHQQDLSRAIDQCGLKPVLDRSFSLSALADAFRYEESGAHFGKISITIP